MAPSRYWAAATEAEGERRRLGLLEQRYDELTVRRVASLGLTAGWSCLEVGAGAGSVAGWLAEAVGPGGSVVATDLDPRFLDGLAARTNVEVRRHDILADPLEEAAFDLVHCRALLCHLADPVAALRRMAAALRPGGWLLVEDADFITLRAADPGHPRAAAWDRFAVDIVAHLVARRAFDPHLGRRLPGLVASLPLADVTHEGLVRIHRGGSPSARFLAASFAAHAESMVSDGFCRHEDLAGFIESLADSSFLFADACSFAVWGRRPI